MLFETLGDRQNPAILFFHAMGVTGASSKPVAQYLKDSYFCILPTSTVYREGQKYLSKAAGDGGRFFHRCRPCHGVSDADEAARGARFL